MRRAAGPLPSSGFGSAANLNLHKRTLSLDGVFLETNDAFQFRRLAGPHRTRPRNHRASVFVIRPRSTFVEKGSGLMKTQGLRPSTTHYCLRSPPWLLCTRLLLVDGYLWASVTVLRWFGIQGAATSEGGYRRCVSGNAFNLHAGVLSNANPESNLRSCCVTCSAPPLANDRLEILVGGDLLLRLKSPYSEGTTHLRFTPTAKSENPCPKTCGCDSQTAKSSRLLPWGVYTQCPAQKYYGCKITQIEKRKGE